MQIYTDWANHYLAKSGHKRLIKDLQQDVTDGVLLAQIIQVVGKSRFDLRGVGLRYYQIQFSSSMEGRNLTTLLVIVGIFGNKKQNGRLKGQ